jgi:predicted nucleotidyltransferase
MKKRTQNFKNSSLKISSRLSKIIQRFSKETRQILKDHLIEEYVFGSITKKSFSRDSDIDILIIVDKFTPDMRWQISSLASDYSLKFNIYISPVIKDINVWSLNQKHDTLFYQEVTKYGISL